jgi:hypothetical protein
MLKNTPDGNEKQARPIQEKKNGGVGRRKIEGKAASAIFLGHAGF